MNHPTTAAESCSDGSVQQKRLHQNCIPSSGGQDIAEYAVMLAVILVLVVGTIRLVGGNCNRTRSRVKAAPDFFGRSINISPRHGAVL